MVEDFIPTVSGKRFYYRDPKADQIELEDIAHGLSLHPRYGGQTENFFSVARHSILVSRELEEKGYSGKIQIYGLLHDAPEAYLGDVPAPLKKNLDNLRSIEDEILDAVWEAFDIDKPGDDEWKKVKEADNTLLHYEAPQLVSLDGWTRDVDRDYSLKSGFSKDREEFLSRFRELVQRY